MTATTAARSACPAARPRTTTRTRRRPPCARRARRSAWTRVVGTLGEVFIPVSDFRITPIVAIADRAPALNASEAEVARILTPPVAAFLPGAPIEIVERRIGDWPLRYGGYRIDGLHVWGATARILG